MSDFNSENSQQENLIVCDLEISFLPLKRLYEETVPRQTLPLILHMGYIIKPGIEP